MMGWHIECTWKYTNSLRTDFVNQLFPQNAKLRKPANVVNPYYARTMWVVSKGPTLLLQLQKTYPSTPTALCQMSRTEFG